MAGRSPPSRCSAEIARGELPCTHETLDRHPSTPAAAGLSICWSPPARCRPAIPRSRGLERWIERASSPSTTRSRRCARSRTGSCCAATAERARRAPLNVGDLSRAKVELRSARRVPDWLAERGRRSADCAPGRYRRVARRLSARTAHIARSVRALGDGAEADAEARLPSRAARRPVPADHQRRPGRARPAAAATIPSYPGARPGRQRPVAVFAQPVIRVARLTVDDVTVDGGERRDPVR